MKRLIAKSVKTAAGQHGASRRPQTTQDGNHIILMKNRPESPETCLKVGHKAPRDRRVPVTFTDSERHRQDPNAQMLSGSLGKPQGALTNPKGDQEPKLSLVDTEPGRRGV